MTQPVLDVIASPVIDVGPSPSCGLYGAEGRDWNKGRHGIEKPAKLGIKQVWAVQIYKVGKVVHRRATAGFGGDCKAHRKSTVGLHGCSPSSGGSPCFDVYNIPFNVMNASGKLYGVDFS